MLAAIWLIASSLSAAICALAKIPRKSRGIDHGEGCSFFYNSQEGVVQEAAEVKVKRTYVLYTFAVLFIAITVFWATNFRIVKGFSKMCAAIHHRQCLLRLLLTLF